MNNPYNSLEYFDKLVAAGVPEKQARVQADELAKIIDSNLATKNDLETTASKLEVRILKYISGMLITQGLAIIGVIASLIFWLHK